MTEKGPPSWRRKILGRVALALVIWLVVLAVDVFVNPWPRMRLDASLLNLPPSYELVFEEQTGETLAVFASDDPQLSRFYVTDDSAEQACGELLPRLRDWLNSDITTTDVSGEQLCRYVGGGSGFRFGTYGVRVSVYPSGADTGPVRPAEKTTIVVSLQQ
ncbi:MAG TPA: hypothetical protein ENH15_05310 [Actinobacteria bacterium]|nr:hypothetical protein [Actinomycetota bacterium]